MVVDIQRRLVPAIAIVGRPNVGKSTLFNRITRSRDALVSDQAGTTRDVRVGVGRIGDASYLVVDTGGLSRPSDELGVQIVDHAERAIADSAAVLLLVDGREGLTTTDEQILAALRRTGKPLHLAINKSEGLDDALLGAEFAPLGIENCYSIAAAHGLGIATLIEGLTRDWLQFAEDTTDDDMDRIHIAIVGRPNVGKSTLINRILGEERMITADQPGTTHDSIALPCERNGRAYVVIDTAGLRRRSKVIQKLEKFSAVKALQAMSVAHVALCVLDGSEGVTDQDLHVIATAISSGRALLIAVNKWDGLNPARRADTQRDLERRLDFCDFAEYRFISALHGMGVGDLFACIDAAYASATRGVATGEVNAILKSAVAAHPPPLSRGRRIKLRYAHLGGRNPPTIVIHGNQLEALPNSYRRYLQGVFRRELELIGTPIRIELRRTDNPYAGRRNILTPRQKKRRRRLLKRVKKR